MSKLNKQQLKNKPTKKKKIINWKKVLILAIFIVYALVSIYGALDESTSEAGDITLVEFYELIDEGKVEKINLNKADNIITIYCTDGELYETINPDSEDFLQEIMERGVVVGIQKKSRTKALISILTTLPLTVIMAMMAIYLSSTILGASTKMFTLIKNENNHTGFDDIKGMSETKKQVQFIISQLRNWKELGELGARPCKGMLLFGPPGVGKTMLAKAIAKESGVGFISCSGSDFDEVFVGVGAGRVRSLFDLAAVNSPCVIFIDEIDCVGRRRRGGDGASQDHNQTLNALLQRMDGINESNGIIVIGATNRKEDLDTALMRPGRFDRHLFVGAPDNKKDRDELVSYYLENKKLKDGVTTEKVSKLMVGLTGAEVEEVLNSAVYVSLQNGEDGSIDYSHIDEAVMQLHTDGVKKEHTDEHDEELVSVHEAGHTIISLMVDVPVAKVSNIPYSSGIGGLTIRDKDKLGDRKLKMQSDMENDIKILLAGKCAEEVIYSEHSQGCQNDIEQATKMIYNMISAFGMDTTKLLNENTLIESGVSTQVSKETIKKCNDLLEKYNNQVYDMLSKHRKELEKLRDMLLKDKTIVEPTLEMLQD